jgi:ribosome-associated protein
MYDEQPEELAPDEVEIEAIGIEVSSQPIELYKIFKLANLVNGGGEAKHIISEGYVAVNGEIETRKRRKMYDGDLVEFNQEYYVILCDLPEGELPEVFEESLTVEEYLVTEAEKARIEQENMPFSNEANSVEGPVENASVGDDTNKAEPSSEEEQKPAKGKGRKSIQFF